MAAQKNLFSPRLIIFIALYGKFLPCIQFIVRMTFHIETARLWLREFRDSDAQDMFVLDADPLVHRFLGNRPVQTIEQARATVSHVRQQYEDHGIGRWIVIEKQHGRFVGWSGLKLVREEVNGRSDYYDVGYRLLPAFWGKGYATESAKAALEYGFGELQLSEIAGTVHRDNQASRKVLEKCGLQHTGSFYWQELPCEWLEISRATWQEKIYPSV